MNFLTINKIRSLIIEKYKLEPISIKKLKSGTINLSYLVKTKIGDFVFRIYKRNNIKRQIEIEHKLINFLKKKNFPTANIVTTINGKTIDYKNKTYFALFNFVAGKHLTKINIKQLKSIARVLGCYHFVVQRYKCLQKKNWWYIESVPLEKYFKCAKSLGASSQFLSLLQYSLKLFRMNTKINEFKKLPHIYIHGDFSLKNLKFVQNKISGVLDFDNARKELRILDFVRPLQSIIRINKRIDKNRIKIFFTEYLKTSQMPLSFLEYKYLIEMFRIQHLKEALWQIRQYLSFKGVKHLRHLKKEIKFLKWLNHNDHKLKRIFESL